MNSHNLRQPNECIDPIIRLITHINQQVKLLQNDFYFIFFLLHKHSSVKFPQQIKTIFSDLLSKVVVVSAIMWFCNLFFLYRLNINVFVTWVCNMYGVETTKKQKRALFKWLIVDSWLNSDGVYYVSRWLLNVLYGT